MIIVELKLRMIHHSWIEPQQPSTKKTKFVIDNLKLAKSFGVKSNQNLVSKDSLIRETLLIKMFKKDLIVLS